MKEKIAMKERIAQIITEYQDTIAEYFEMEVPMDHDAETMDCFLENLKAEILELIK